MGLGSDLMHAWNAFRNRSTVEQTQPQYSPFVQSHSSTPARVRPRITNERTIISSVYTRMAVDATMVDLRHVRLDDQDRYKERIRSGLDECLNLSANLDQSAIAFKLDLFMTLFDKGVIAVVPVDVDINPEGSGGYSIESLRVGEIVDWFADSVRVSLYNEDTMQREQIKLKKKNVAIIENPFYNVMNEPNSTLRRLQRKLALLDSVDEAASTGKLDIIIQVPYTVRGDIKRSEAQRRRSELEDQMRDSKFGIGYIDATERITQLNRPAENNMFAQIQYLEAKLYKELGLTPDVFEGTADEATMLNYNNRTIKVLIEAVTQEFRRKFFTKTARSQGQSVMGIRDPFALVPVEKVAEIADKFARNEIMSSNEIRQGIGLAPSKDPKADELINANMPQPKERLPGVPNTPAQEEPVVELKQIR